MNDAQKTGRKQTGDVPLATVSARFGALLVDWLLCLIVAALIAPVYGGSVTADPWLGPSVLVAEYTFFLGILGRTPGMYLTKIRCASAAHGGPIGLPRAFLRGLLLVLIVPPLIMDSYGRGWHDRAAGSVMLSAR